MSMKVVAAILFFFQLSIYLHAQVTVESSVIDYGIIQRGSNKIKDIVITNSGSKKTLVLKSNFSREFDILFSSREVLPDSSVILRVKIKPIQKERFSEKVEIWFSTENKPLVLEFKADVQWIDPADNSPCPDFSSQPYDCCPNNEFEVKVKHANTGQPLNARIRIVNDGRVVLDQRSGKQGQLIAEMPVSWYFIEASQDGYIAADTSTYINSRNNYFELFLQPLDDDPLDPETVQENLILEIPDASPDSVALIPDIPLPALNNQENTGFKRSNNIVFLIDVSQSMAGMGKMDLLKASVFALVSELRAVDNVSVITYASEAKMILSKSNGTEKNEILNAVNSLTAGGMTAGTRGFRMAYETAQRNFIEGGNNQVIVVTDGAFRASDNPLIIDMARKQSGDGIITSLVGIKSKPLAREALSEIAIIAGGNFVSIANLDEASEALLSEVKIQSSR